MCAWLIYLYVCIAVCTFHLSYFFRITRLFDFHSAARRPTWTRSVPMHQPSHPHPHPHRLYLHPLPTLLPPLPLPLPLPLPPHHHHRHLRQSTTSRSLPAPRTLACTSTILASPSSSRSCRHGTCTTAGGMRGVPHRESIKFVARH